MSNENTKVIVNDNIKNHGNKNIKKYFKTLPNNKLLFSLDIIKTLGFTNIRLSTKIIPDLMFEFFLF
jgi:hypothetical protein